MIRNVAVLGAGIGAQHIGGYLALPDDFRVATVCDLNQTLASSQAERCGATITDSIDAVLADASVDVVDICLPPSLHVPVALDALAVGKHVVLEKPIAGSLADADRLAKAETSSQGQLFPVFQYRFGKAFSQLNALCDAGLLGQPQVAALETHWDRGSDYYDNPWRGSWKHELGGAVLSHAIHAHDLLTNYFGPIAEVSAMLTTRANPIETEDCAALAFRFSNGAVATSSITLGAASNESRYRFVFENVTAESGTSPYAPGEVDWSFLARNAANQAKIDALVRETADGPAGFAGFLAAIAQTLNGEPGHAVTIADGVASIELVSAIYHADRTGARVTLPLDRSLPICRNLKP